MTSARNRRARSNGNNSQLAIRKLTVCVTREAMTKHIGIVAGSSEGAALCYRTICLEAPAIMGEHNHPEITMNCVPMSEHMPHIVEDDWAASAELLLASARKVAQAGADFAICPDNTYHQAIDMVRSRSRIPWLHIA